MTLKERFERIIKNDNQKEVLLEMIEDLEIVHRVNLEHVKGVSLKMSIAQDIVDEITEIRLKQAEVKKLDDDTDLHGTEIYKVIKNLRVQSLVVELNSQAYFIAPAETIDTNPLTGQNSVSKGYIRYKIIS